MAMVKGTELRPGMVIRIDGEILVVVKMTHITPGNWRGIVQTKLKNITKGNSFDKRLSPEDKIEILYLDKRDAEYIYNTQHAAVFQDLDSFEDIEIPLDQVEDQLPFLPLNSKCKINLIEGMPIAIDLPSAVELRVVEAPPAVRGDTATNVNKLVKTETGLEVRTPAHIKEGDVIKVNTTTGEFLERVSIG